MLLFVIGMELLLAFLRLGNSSYWRRFLITTAVIAVSNVFGWSQVWLSCWDLSWLFPAQQLALI